MEHSKRFTSLAEMLVAVQSMTDWQKIHNVLRKDYMELLKITKEHLSSEKEFNALYRACIRSLFSLIETDVFGLNTFDKYGGYKDRADFKTKFKETYKQIGNTWNKNEIVSKYIDSKWQELLEFRRMRDELIHPKNMSHIHTASENEFLRLEKVFNDYADFVRDIMTDFYMSTTLNVNFSK